MASVATGACLVVLGYGLVVLALALMSGCASIGTAQLEGDLDDLGVALAADGAGEDVLAVVTEVAR